MFQGSIPDRHGLWHRVRAALLLALIAAGPACEEALGVDFGEYREPSCDDEPSCEACSSCGCLDETNACLNSPDCVAWVQCTTGCDDTSCWPECDAAYPEGRALFDDYSTCIDEQCPSACLPSSV